MKLLSCMTAVLAVVLVFCALAPACADDVESTMPIAVLGIDAYLGTSDMAGSHRLTDGMWAGCGTFYPSIAYLQWNSPNGSTSRVSFGIGDLYTDSENDLDQPVEAYWQTPMGNTTLTFGKFWVPFAQQEWLYESKPGVMAQWERGRMSLVAAANYDVDFNTPKLYARGGYSLTEGIDIGLSYALGEGFCSDSIHNRGFALDTTIGFAGLRFYGEYNYFDADEPGNTFNYISGKLYYEGLGKITPFVGRFSWNDRSDAFGEFRSTVYGVTYQVSPTLSLEGAIADTTDGDVTWLQMRWNWEKSILPRW